METRWGLMGVVLLALVACGSDRAETVRDEAEIIGHSFCAMLQRCNQGVSDAETRQCVSNYVDGVCDNYDCDARPVASEEQIRACADTLDTHGCTPDADVSACDDILH